MLVGHNLSLNVLIEIDLSKSLQTAIEDDRFVIALENLSPRRRQSASQEVLLSVEFPHSKQEIAIALDRKNGLGKNPNGLQYHHELVHKVLLITFL